MANKKNIQTLLDHPADSDTRIGPSVITGKTKKNTSTLKNKNTKKNDTPDPEQTTPGTPIPVDDGITSAPVEVTTPSNVLKLSVVPLITIRAGQRFYITIADGKIYAKGCKVTIQ